MNSGEDAKFEICKVCGVENIVGRENCWCCEVALYPEEEDKKDPLNNYSDESTSDTVDCMDPWP